MREPDVPVNEQQRQAALDRLGILDTSSEERFDRITRLAQRFLGAPIVLVSLVDRDRQWFKSRQGLDASQTPRGISFCGHAILGEDLFLVPDALADPRFVDNPLVTGAPGIRFYAGVPLRAPEGERVGTLCAIDRVPRDLSGEQQEVLRDLAACVEGELGRTHLLGVAAQLTQAEARIRAIVENVVDGILTIDEAGSVQEMNPAAERIFGYPKDEVLGRNVNILMPRPYAAEHDAYLSRYRETGERRIIGIGREVEGKRKDGSVFPVELSVGELTVAETRLFTGVVRDVSERKEAEARLQAVTTMRQAILDSASVAIISTDPDGIIRTFNRTAESWLGLDAEALIGRESPAVFHDPAEVARRAESLTRELGRPVAPGFEAFVAKARLGGVDVKDWTYVRRDGTRFPVQLAVTALKDASGKINGFLGTAIDLTERRLAEKLKNEFVSTVSHELRTPLTSIRGALSLVLGKAGKDLSEKARRLLEMAERNSERLTHLINDLLDLEKLEGGRLDFDLKGLDLVGLARRAVEDNEAFARRHDVRLELRHLVPSALVRGDEHRLLQVFANLISNAAKFSPAGGEVVVSVEAVPGGRARASVRDRGPGIPEHFRASIFQRFAQADSSDSREKGGTGLGLSITKAIVERLDGRIGYETWPGGGTVFHFDLPLLEERREGLSLEGPRALICEDNPDVAGLLAELLGEEGLVCDIAGSLRVARDFLGERPYRLLLLDLTLPDGDGLELLHELRAQPATAGLPVVVVSGKAREGRKAGLDSGALSVVDWLQKPLDRDHLRRALEVALRRPGVRARILHVEDDPDVAQLTAALLEGHAEYCHVGSRAGAAERLAAEDFDLVLLDLTLGDGSGADLLEVVRGRCPVVIFSARSPGAKISQAVEAALLKSRASNEELLAVIKNALSRA
jgi:PAS domain S-box-containing protein